MAHITDSPYDLRGASPTSPVASARGLLRVTQRQQPTDAQIIASIYGDDGKRYMPLMNAGTIRLTSQLPVKFTAKTNLPDLVSAIPGVEIEHSGPKGARSRFVFPDGSVLVNTSDGWDFEDPDHKWCFAEGKCGDAAKGISKFAPPPKKPDAIQECDHRFVDWPVDTKLPSPAPAVWKICGLCKVARVTYPDGVDVPEGMLERVAAVLAGRRLDPQSPDLQTVTAADVALIAPKDLGLIKEKRVINGDKDPDDGNRGGGLLVEQGDPNSESTTPEPYKHGDPGSGFTEQPTGEFNDTGDSEPGDVDTIAEALKAGGVPGSGD